MSRDLRASLLPMTDGVDRLIAQWRRELPSLPTEAMALIGRLGQLAELWTASIDATLAEFGLKVGEFDVLASLRRAGEPFELTPTDLYRGLMLSSGGMTHRLQRLESRGWITRRSDPVDGRSFRVALTAKGRRLIEQAVVAHVENEERLLSPLSPEERAALEATVRKLLASTPR